MIDAFQLEAATNLNEVLVQGDKQFNLGLLQLRLSAK
jgi:carboxyl-terminal processing protease